MANSNQMEVTERTSLLMSSSSTSIQKLMDLSTRSASSDTATATTAAVSFTSSNNNNNNQATNITTTNGRGHDNNDGHYDNNNLQQELEDKPGLSSSSSSSSSTSTSTSTSTGTTINYSSNVLLVYRLHEMRSVSQINLWLAILCLIYLGINICLICVNYVNFQYDNNNNNKTHSNNNKNDDDNDEEPVNDTVYHLVEFWATFCFAIVEYMAIVYTPKAIASSSSSSSSAGGAGGGGIINHHNNNNNNSSSSSSSMRNAHGGKIISNPIFLRIVMFINIVATITPAVMISFSIETFEIPSHEIEYINELTMTFIDIIIAVSLLWNNNNINNNNSTSLSSSKKNKNKNNKRNIKNYGNDGDGEDHNNTIPTTTPSSSSSSKHSMWTVTFIALVVALVVALIQLGVYNLMGYDEESGDMVGEPLGHFLEFIFEIVSSSIAFLFCMDNKFIADQEISIILYSQFHEQHDTQKQLSTLVDDHCHHQPTPTSAASAAAAAGAYNNNINYHVV